MKLHRIFSAPFKKMFFGKKKYQPFFELLHGFALNGMHYGQGSNVVNSGEQGAIAYIASKLGDSKSLTLFDVGANIGNYSAMLLRHFKNIRALYSFEPSPTTYNKLKERFTDAAIVHALNFALSDTAGTAILYKTETNSEISSLAPLYNTPEKYGALLQETIHLTTLDIFCRENSIESIDFLKIDVEGFESNVLTGATHLLQAKKIRFVQFEFGVPNLSSRTYFKDLWDILSPNYHVYRIVKDGLSEIKTYSSTCEIFSTTNFIAALKQG